MARVPYLTQKDLPDEYQDRFEVDEADPADVVINIHRAMANNPHVLAAWAEWVTRLYEEDGDARTRELAILAVASLVESRYVWQQHVPIALDEGVSPTEILAISNQDYDEFPQREAALLRYVMAFATGAVDEAAHTELSNVFDDRMVITTVFLVTEYVGISKVVDALAVELDGEFVGWELEHH